jgi:hypothetical protein
VEFEWPDRDSREWLLGPRGAELEPWSEAAANLPDAALCIAAMLCVANSPPTIWMRDEAVDDLTLWDTMRSAVQRYDAGERDPELWREVLGGTAHLLLLAR